MSDRWQPFPPSKPLPVEGGVKARSSRGAIAQTWWSERFVEVLENLGIGGRLQRGRSYARKGQVLSLAVDPGLVTAQVQGSRSTPYRVRIGIAAYGKTEWAQVEAALAGNAWYAAKLLAGEMPEDVEDVFADHGLSLFPGSADELSLDCSCPDWAVPCKHIAAVFYLLAESFDEDPFTILAWRGRERQDLLDNLQAARSAGASDGTGTVDRIGQPLAECLDSYFALQAELPVTEPPPGSPTLLVDQLPPVDLTIRNRPVADLIRPVYIALDSSPPPADAP
jgi:uncharacterized Zn finger protein